jgi:hypothetical protein
LTDLSNAQREVFKEHVPLTEDGGLRRKHTFMKSSIQDAIIGKKILLPGQIRQMGKDYERLNKTSGAII